MTNRIWRVCAAIIVIVAMRAEPARACSCAMSGPPCQATWSVDVVFTGVVRSIESIDHVELGGPNQSRRVRFDVERGLKGITPGQSDVITGMGTGDCGYRFEVGKRYVVYGWRSAEGRLSTGICSRTRPIEAADEDLKYLSSIPPAGSGARIYGRITQIERDPGEDNYVDYGPVEGLLVSAHGTAFTLDATTDKDGRFEIVGVPPGKATVAVLPRPIFSSRHLETPIEIKDPRACAEVSFQVHWEARISGTVLDPGGQPAKGVTVEAIAAEDAAAPRTTRHPQVKTDAAGRFELLDFSPGSYVVGVNLARPPQVDNPYPPSFFPGTTEPAEATTIEIAPGDDKELPPFRLGTRLPESAVSGCVVWPDGQPAIGIPVSIRHTTQIPVESPRSMQSDAGGCFSFSVLRTAKYSILSFATRPGEPAQRMKAEAAILVSDQPPRLRLVLSPIR